MVRFGEKRNVSPITKWIEFSGKTGNFTYYDKEAAERKEVKIWQLVIVLVWYKIKWYDDKAECSIYSQEAEHLGKTITAMSKKEWLIAKWKRKDIKEKVEAKGGKLHISMNCVMDWELVNISLKWHSFYVFSEVLQKIEVEENKIMYTKNQEHKKGTIKYVVADWDQGTALTKEDYKQAEDFLKELDEYHNSKKEEEKKELGDIEEETKDEVEAEDDLPF